MPNSNKMEGWSTEIATTALPEILTTFDFNLGLNSTSNTSFVTTSTAPRPKMISEFIEYQMYLRMLGIYPFFTTTLGTVGNGLVILILSQKRMRMTSSCIYMAALAVADTVVLWTYLFNMLSRLYINWISGPLFCKFLNYISSVSSQMSVWLVVSMTIERFIAVYFPFKAGKFCTTKNARIAILCILAFFLCLGSHEFVTTYFHPTRRICRHDVIKYALFLEIFNYVDASLSCYIPEILLFTFNFMIIAKLKKTYAKQKELTNDAGKDKSEQAKQVTTMLLTVSLTFAFLMTPFAIFYVSSIYFVDMRVPHTYAISALVHQITVLLIMINHTINFLLYCISGKRFRNELRRLICCWEDPKETASKYTMSTMANSASRSTVATVVDNDKM